MEIALLILEKFKTLWPFILKNWKGILIILLGILVVILYLSRRSEKNRADEAEKGRDAAIIISNGWQEMSTVYKNKFGEQVIKTKAVEVDKANIEAIAKSKELQWLNNQKFGGLKKNLSNVLSAESFTTEFDLGQGTSIKDAVPEKIKYLPCKDSVRAFAFDLHDQWNDIHAVVIDTPRIEIRDKCQGVIELRRIKGWFWKGLVHLGWGNTWEPISEITNSNKLIKIDSVAVFVVKH